MDTRYIRNAINFMWEHYDDEELTVKEVASIAGYTRYYFTRMFTKTTGVPPMRYLAAIRRYESMVLLSTGNMPSGHIPYMVGLRSSGTFASQFKNRVGVTPSGFRSLCKERDIMVPTHNKDSFVPPIYELKDAKLVLCSQTTESKENH